MKLRTVLRNSDHQLGIEKSGAICTEFLTSGNISWLLSHFHKWETTNPTPENAMAMHEILNEKLQSKVEYRCINCSPFLIRFSRSNLYQPFLLNPSITDENKYASLHLIAPLLLPDAAPLKFSYLSGAHKLPALPRGTDIAGYYEHDSAFVSGNFSSFNLKGGEAAISLSNIPISLPNTSTPILEIAILPYEARQIIYERKTLDTGAFLQPYETDLADFIKLKTGIESARDNMKPLKVMPYSPVFITETEKYTLLKSKSPLEKLLLQLTRLRNNFNVNF